MTLQLETVHDDCAFRIGDDRTVRDANSTARAYFGRRRGEEFEVELNRNECFSRVVGARLPPPLLSWCHLWNSYQGRRKREPESCLVGLRFSPEREREAHRHYELFMCHLRPTGEHEILVRLLPFPTAMGLDIQDNGLPARASDLGVLWPASVTVSAKPFLDSTTFALEALRDRVRGEMAEAKTFYMALQQALLRGDDPNAAWSLVANEYPRISQVVPAPISRAVRASSPEDGIQVIREAWEYPLDAPVLLNEAYPAIRKALLDDTDLRFTPSATDDDRDRYFKLHIPLSDLEEEDRCFGWLPAHPEENYLRVDRRNGNLTNVVP